MTDRAQLAALGAQTFTGDQAADRAMRAQVEGVCWAIAGVLDRDQIEPLTASVDRLICALADAREALADHDEAGGTWPSDLGEPLRCGTLGAHVEQPAPLPGTGDVWQEVIDGLDLDDPIRPICIARRTLGVERYGTPLQRGNGRDEVRDTDEEIADALVYAQAEGDLETVEDCKRIMRRRLRRREGRG